MKEIIKLFTEDKVTDISPLGNGHINFTYCVTLENADGTTCRMVLQKINNYVFPDVKGLMDNMCKVTQYLKENLPTEKDPDRSVMSVIPALDGNSYVQVNGEYYRCLDMVEGTVTYQVIENREDFYRCAAAFAEFQKQLSAFPADTLRETIPNFHNTESRFSNFLKSVELNISGRKSLAEKEIEFCLERKSLASQIVKRLENGSIPLRVIHNDTKLNNILFDRQTNLPLCVVDLDTVMPGAACYDFGDLIRYGGSANVAAEALDSLHWPEILGSLAGDNTILLIIRTNEEVPGVIARIQEMMK